jgi:hypothetical protein
MMGTNIGAVLNWVRGSLPEGEEALDDAAKRLSGDAGRVPMAVTFASQMATFDMAVSLETIEVIAEIAAEERAREAEAEAEVVPPEG